MMAQISVIVLDVLLAATLVYLTVLMQRLKALRTYKNDMKSVVNDVILATESARDAVSKLKGAVVESQTSLAQHVEDARKIESTIELKLSEAQRIMQALDKSLAGPEIKRELEKGALSQRIASRSESVRPDVIPATRIASPHQAPPTQEVFDPEMSERLITLSEAVSNLRAKIAANS